ncbi:MAG: L-2-hydroxyglutarate oxidase [Balneola sp.]
MFENTYDFTIVGAGIIGLSTAYKLSLSFPEAKILVLEKEAKVAAHQTGKNSGVIHSGIYYQPGSYKAKNCIDGRHQLVQFCKENEVAIDICGKVIVATEEEELDRLDAIYKRGLENEIEGIAKIGVEELAEIEPHVKGVAAINVPCAGIVDYAGMCRKLQEKIEASGGNLSFGEEVTAIKTESDHLVISTKNNSFTSRYLVNCAGLYCDRVAKSAGVKSPIQIVPFKGEYYELKPEAEYLVNHLIYPLPHKDFPFLGVHFTRMALGGIECGPNAVPVLKREGYEKLSFDMGEALEMMNFPGFWKLAFNHWRMGLDEYHRSLSKSAFVKGLQKLIPSVQADHLEVAPSGVRAMALKPNGEILDDFYFEVADRQIHVLNAPSPAATAALAIGDEIIKKVKAEFFAQEQD